MVYFVFARLRNAEPAVTPLTTTGRPPWTGNNTICLHGGYVDVLYVFDSDSSNPGVSFIASQFSHF